MNRDDYVSHLIAMHSVAVEKVETARATWSAAALAELEADRDALLYALLELDAWSVPVRVAS